LRFSIGFELLSLSASIASFGTFAIRSHSTSSAACTRLRFLWQLSASFRSRKLDCLRCVSVCFLHLQLHSCSCVSTSLDFLSFRRPHLPFVFAFARFRLRPLRLRALTFDCYGIVSLAFDPPGWSSSLSTSAAYFRIFAFGFAFDFFSFMRSPSMSLALLRYPSASQTSFALLSIFADPFAALLDATS
jgi:hypothetical protein